MGSYVDEYAGDSEEIEHEELVVRLGKSWG